jgi:hypothetical protein
MNLYENTDSAGTRTELRHIANVLFKIEQSSGKITTHTFLTNNEALEMALSILKELNQKYEI